MFGFMRRKTDFFSMNDQAKSTVINALDKHAKLFSDDKVRQQLIERKKKEELAKRKEAEEAKKTKVIEDDSSKIVEVTDEEARQIELAEAAKKAGKSGEEVKDSDKKDGDEEDGKEKGAKPNAGNGGQTEKYDWEQTLGEVTVNVKIPKDATAKTLDVVMT